MKYLFFLLLFIAAKSLHAQELYVFTEPASNMPSHSVSPKFSTNLGNFNGKVKQGYVSEVMFGFNKKLMMHVATTFSNMSQQNVGWEGVYLYGKYRFLSKDDVHKHFRMAAFAEGGYSKNPLHYDELSVQGNISGLQGGLIATQLINKVAVSGTASYIKALKKPEVHDHTERLTKALNYTLSAGYLVLPVEYKSYDQLNFNVYMEILAQQGLDKRAYLTNKKVYYVDMAPAVQFIFNSNSKLNIGYRQQIKGAGQRSMKSSFLVSFEHTFFNALKKKTYNSL